MQATLRRQFTHYLPAQRDFLIGLSGGVDSVVLLHLLARFPELNLRAVHIHHGLSQNADDWAAFCATLCQHYAIPLTTQKVRVNGHHGLESNARDARYHAIGKLIQPNEVLITAHHLDDQAETFLLALKRGSGVKGLAAMPVLGDLHNMCVFRPLLGVNKRDILAYAVQENLHWFDDESNNDEQFDRNFLRQRILPQLNQRWQQFNQMVGRAALHCAEQQQLIEELLADELKQRLGSEQQLAICGFEHFSEPKQRQLVRLWLEKQGVAMPSTAQLQAVIHDLIFAKQDKSPCVKIGDNEIRRYRQAIFITSPIRNLRAIRVEIPPHTDSEIAIAELGTIRRFSTELLCTIFGKTHRLSLPLELEHQVLTLAFGYGGKVREYGKSHREEMKKIWQKHGIAQWKRESTPLIFWQDQLIAVLT